MKKSKLIQKIKQINEALPGLLAGIMAYGVICQIIGLLVTKDKVGYTTGLWIGIGVACLSALNMAVNLNQTLKLDAKQARIKSTVRNITRYLVILVVLGILMVTGFANPLSAFLGIMGLKISAYMYPVFQKLYTKIRNK